MLFQLESFCSWSCFNYILNVLGDGRLSTPDEEFVTCWIIWRIKIPWSWFLSFLSLDIHLELVTFYANTESSFKLLKFFFVSAFVKTEMFLTISGNSVKRSLNIACLIVRTHHYFIWDNIFTFARKSFVVPSNCRLVAPHRTAICALHLGRQIYRVVCNWLIAGSNASFVHSYLFISLRSAWLFYFLPYLLGSLIRCSTSRSSFGILFDLLTVQSKFY